MTTKYFENLKLKVWQIIYAPLYGFKYWRNKKKRSSFLILNSFKTVDYIIEHKCSVSRFGDGELGMVYHYLNHGEVSDFYIQAFQQYDERLATKLYSILQDDNNDLNYKVAIPYSIVSVNNYIGLEKVFWQRFVVLDIDRFSKLFKSNYIYLDSCFTRFFLNHRKVNFKDYVSRLKKIWDGLNICIIEGENSRLGVGNDLFDNAESINRILCPAINAYSKYDEILASVKRYNVFDIYLIALGHAATVLAYDLACMGLWAIDIGHIDIEYEWFMMNAKKKVAIPDKYVNEVPEGRVLTESHDSIYISQIIDRI